ncbi:hypothetical protein B9Z55_027908 [Caenorhabditis nigoni]|uniref:Tc1-like transposase DDE domain-containing protein n=1 Tax=Caenorhabditis nigoni TaxID=1611254 RepID=A0A2G5SEC1_9PELO|nr:hypothetical protein B9Z55_027908 [Caenorhabditis nigoni]
MNSDDYIIMLKTAMFPFFRNRRKSHRFQQDNASIHKSTQTLAWFSQEKIEDMEWPACSPDLNPIENLCGILVRRVYRHGKQYGNAQELKNAISDAWDSITPAETKSLSDSMPNRLVEVFAKQGGVTSY